MKTHRIPLVLLAACLAWAPRAWPRSPAAGARPNIVVMLADDLGYGDVHALNPRSGIPTPNLDRLAAEGMRFTDAHSPSAVCTPTRYGLLTGRYCWRTRLKRGVLNGYSPPLLQPGRATLASLLHRAGYATSVVGKWHLGLGFSKDAEGKIDFRQPVQPSPNDFGFDDSFVIPASLDFPPYVFVENHRIADPSVVEEKAQSFPAFHRKGERSKSFAFADCLDQLLEHAKGFLRRASSQRQPFFLYFALTAPHKPVLPHPRFRGKTALGPYGDFVVQLDWTVGEVLRTLKELGAMKNTLFIFTSDNGSFMYRREDPDQGDHVSDPGIQAYYEGHHRSNFVFRGTKADIWEGGHRVPFLARWDGVVAPGSLCDSTLCHTDFFATFADLVRGPAKVDTLGDSYSFLPLLKGDVAEHPRPPVIHHSGGGMFAIRSGRWKLVLGNGSGGRERPRGKPFQEPFALFDLEHDLRERHNLATGNVSMVEDLKTAFFQIYQR